MILTYPFRYTVFIAAVLCLVGYLLISSKPVALTAEAATDTQLRFVDGAGAPLANTRLRLLCYDSTSDESPNHDLNIETNQFGSLDAALPADCSQLAALQLHHRQPAGKAGRDSSYLVYTTSWQPGTKTLLPAQGDISIHSQWRLVLFDVAVALEWEEAASSTYVNSLREGMRNASAYLYDLSDGQMAFGALTITVGGENWDNADIRIRAANDARPSARVGGIVGALTPFTTSTGLAITYAPGEILTGRGWDGDSAARGDWSQPAGYRTLVHEWLHYALFLYDEYQQSGEFGREERYCTCDELPQLVQNSAQCGGANQAASAMAYHYTASELWLSGLPASCANSDQQLVHGQSDWQTLGHWGEIQGSDSEWLTLPQKTESGPLLGLVADLFDTTPTSITAENRLFLPLISRSGQAQSRLKNQTQQSHEITMTVVVSAGNLDLAALDQFQLQIYSLHPATAAQPARIVHQGTTLGNRESPDHLGSIALLGVQPGDRLFVQADRYVRNGESVASLRADAALQAGQSTISLVNNRWDGGLEVTPMLHDGRLNSLNLVLSTTLSLPISPTVRLCVPDAAIGCNSGWQTRLALAANGSWQGMLQSTRGEALPHFGYLWLDAGEAGTLIRWFQAAGGVGPAHMFGEAPLRDGMVTVDASPSMRATASAVFIMPADLQMLVHTPLPPGSNGLIGTPLDLQIAAEGDHPKAITTFFYDKTTLQRLGIGDNKTQLLRYDRLAGRWQPVVGLTGSSAMGWIASPAGEVGIFAVAWSAQPGVGRSPAILLDTEPVNLGDSVRTTILLPANPAAGISATGTISYLLPTRLTLQSPPHCSIGNCFYEEVNRTVQWSGTLGEERGVVLSLEAILEESVTCDPQLLHSATVFDGVQHSSLSAITQIDCIPAPVKTVTPTPTITATPPPPTATIPVTATLVTTVAAHRRSGPSHFATVQP